MNFFRTLVMVGLVGVGMVYGETRNSQMYLVSFSTSPDGKTDLYYRMTYPKKRDPAPEFFLIRKDLLTETKELSYQSPNYLQRDFSFDKTTGVDDDEMLLREIANNILWKRKGEDFDGAFCYYVNWSPDSKWVSIDGGAHNFERLIVYHWDGTNCVMIHLPDWKEKEAYVKDYSITNVEELGVEKMIQKNVVIPRSSNNFIESSFACWLSNGIIAYSTHPTICDLLHNRDEIAPSAPPYFLIDCKTQPKATIIGFAK
jgi:hypothetical protein